MHVHRNYFLFQLSFFSSSRASIFVFFFFNRAFTYFHFLSFFSDDYLLANWGIFPLTFFFCLFNAPAQFTSRRMKPKPPFRAALFYFYFRVLQEAHTKKENCRRCGFTPQSCSDRRVHTQRRKKHTDKRSALYLPVLSL